tara:strand:+ start:761 stop:3670 length:2910 start_codon:yes stop_codon:yes gene_type:complete
VKHYSAISNFYNTPLSRVNNISIDSLIDLIYANNDRKLIVYDDLLYNHIIDSIDLNWENDSVLILAPKDKYSNIAPHGFNQYNQHSVEYFSKIYLSIIEDIRSIMIPKSAENITINNKKYEVYTIDNRSEYEDVLDFCEKNYIKVDSVDGMNQYAKRGGIIDVYPDISSTPKRVCFLDDSTEIKSFNIDTQISYEKIDKIKIPIQKKSPNIEKLLFDNSVNWKKITLNANSSIVINKDINGNIKEFPFKKINYQEYIHAIKNKKYNVKFEPINRLSGFIVKSDQIIVPEWFRNNDNSSEYTSGLDVSSIDIGDYIVHRDYGVGQFIGFKIINDSDHDSQELIVIKYADSSNISIDINHIDKITFYAPKNNIVQLDSIAKNRTWMRKRNRVEKNVQNIVNNLLNTHINRENSYRDSIDAGKDENQFINDFNHIETIDQNRCWEDIKSDFKKNLPMDRLICGDVGFGKTEMAIRAAYRYISNNKKVIVLAPTTILSEQLYNSFHNRIHLYGGVLDRISRFRSNKEIITIKKLWIDNKIDILIGTHSLLYNRIYLEACDLLIVDEEHRFGVKQKEKIKNINPNVDILTMSATPIPRTLNMALSGIKKISTLSSPPKHRKPIITNIAYFNMKLIINSINSEIFRGGQIYFVHNNVDTLPYIVGLLKENLSHLKINYIHGKMNSNIIEKRMKKFTNKEVDILVATSIIENGIDIPNVNTIIINNAHKFGLSQLYQIRGRVGRSNNQAYAFLMIPQKYKLSSIAYSRLKTIEKYTHLGSGYKIANMDLTIRGGGSLFGYNQSGNIENIGYELVTKLINDYANQNNISFININFINKGIIPVEYIESEKIRLLTYRQIKEIQSKKELSAFIHNIQDRFGKIPKKLKHIINIQKIYIICKKLFIHSIEEKRNLIIIKFKDKFWEQNQYDLLNKINEFVKQQSINYEVKEIEKYLIIKLKINNNHDAMNIVNEFLKKL